MRRRAGKRGLGPCRSPHTCPGTLQGGRGGGTHLAEHLGLAHEDEDIGGQDGDAEVEQDDGAL